MTMLFTNQKIDVVNIPLKPMEKIHHESSPLFEENNVKETKQVCETLLKEAHQQKEILLKEALEEIEQMKKAEGVTEKLKEENQMEWVGRMNNIRNRTIEIVNNELIYT